ncbi:tyrosyl-DNA phosphodiesterase 2 isoform X3 [Nothobranchius furzeri]|uniref:tyrosyl-DNA phosphodiesterase 2 isoform X3 n=1 Tax=Nothobranchius furzeri TaxID=105023 RepID=UPI003904C9A1
MASSSDTHQPSVSDVEKDRTRLCEEFASITGNHSDVAQCYLAENDWQMERALNSFFEADMERVFEEDFEENDTPKKKQKVEKTPPEDCIDLTKDSPAAQKPTDEDDNKLSLMSWNVDGLDSDNLQERARGLCSFLVLITGQSSLTLWVCWILSSIQEAEPYWITHLERTIPSWTSRFASLLIPLPPCLAPSPGLTPSLHLPSSTSSTCGTWTLSGSNYSGFIPGTPFVRFLKQIIVLNFSPRLVMILHVVG